MTLTLRLGKKVRGAEIVSAVEDCMKMMDNPTYRNSTGWNRLTKTRGKYLGEAMLHAGHWYPISLVDLEYKPHPHVGWVSVYKKKKEGNLIIDIARKNQDYKRALNRTNTFALVPPIPIITAFQAAGMLLMNRLDENKPQNYAKITYDDNIFVEIDETITHDSLDFHVNALHPEHAGGVVKSMHDVHFEPAELDFRALCSNICRKLKVPSGPALKSLYETRE
ncbi:hypothetical protein ACFL3V_00660 [Nanoarchaeota archaeon]